MMAYCNNCGKEIRDEAKFCPNCGTKILNNGEQGNDGINASKSNWKKDKAKGGKKKTRIIIAVVLIGSIILNFVQFFDRNYKYDIDNRRGGLTRSEISQSDITMKGLSSDEISIGDYITFGRYEQDNDSTNGVEDIEWRVLNKATSDSDGRNCILVISRYALDCLPYNEEDVTWETCDLREWLNDEFYYGAFSEAERNKIMTKKNNNPDASSYVKSWEGKGGNVTSDNVFLLSYEQAENFFENEDDRECYPTDYAMWNGAIVNTEHHLSWWLRSPGSVQYAAMSVEDGGYLDDNSVGADWIGVRPALWIYVD